MLKHILIFNLIIIPLYADLSNNNFIENSNVVQMYQLIKQNISNLNYLTHEEVIRFNNLKNAYKNYKKNKKKNKFDENLLKEYRTLKKINNSANLNKNINDIFIKSKFFPELMDSQCEWTENELKALNILTCNEKNNGIFKDIDLNYTKTGYFVNLINLINNSENVDIIQERLKTLQDIDIDELEQMYNSLKNIEDKFMMFFSDDEAYKRFKLGDNQFNAYIDLRNNIIKKTSHANKKFIFLFINPSFIIFSLIHILTQSIFTGNLTILKFFFGSVFDCNIYKEISKKTNILTGVMSLVICIFNYYLLFNIVNKFYSYFNPYNFYNKLAKSYKIIKTYISTIENIFNIFQNNENLMFLFQDKLKYTRNFFVDNVDYTKDQINLRKLLNQIPADWKYWKHWGKARAGKFCEVLYTFDKNKELFINIIFEIANLERYINIVKLLKNKYYENYICLPKFNDKLTKPSVLLNGVWNPFIKISDVVTNNVKLGVDTDEHVSTAILYGMNAGGKTTILDSIALSYVFGRSFGFSFAKDAEFSYFKRLFITKDISTDIKNGCSKFQAETICVDKLLEVINNFKENEFCLLLSDELFSGTNPETSNILSVNILRHLYKKSNIITLFSTHNIKPTELPKEYDLIKNYVMDIDIEGNNINYKYKFINFYDSSDELLKYSKKIATNLIKKMHKNKLIKNGNIILDYDI